MDFSQYKPISSIHFYSIGSHDTIATRTNPVWKYSTQCMLAWDLFLSSGSDLGVGLLLTMKSRPPCITYAISCYVDLCSTIVPEMFEKVLCVCVYVYVMRLLWLLHTLAFTQHSDIFPHNKLSPKHKATCLHSMDTTKAINNNTAWSLYCTYCTSSDRFIDHLTYIHVHESVYSIYAHLHFMAIL